jgi:hypothetical protein
MFILTLSASENATTPSAQRRRTSRNVQRYMSSIAVPSLKRRRQKIECTRRDASTANATQGGGVRRAALLPLPLPLPPPLLLVLLLPPTSALSGSSESELSSESSETCEVADLGDAGAGAASSSSFSSSCEALAKPSRLRRKLAVEIAA